MNQLGSSSSADQDRDQQQQQQLQVAGDHDQQATGPIDNRRRAAAVAIAIIGGGGQQQQQQNQNQNQNQPIHHQHHHPHPPPQPCPRCNSTNTKFCYYNNYCLAQPRYFCKACRRYWTQGGTLRNVPVGGGGRKTKRTRADDDPAATYQRRREQQPSVVVSQPPPQPPLVPPRRAAVEQAVVVNRTSNVALMTAGGATAGTSQRGLTPTAGFNYPGNNSGSTGFLSSFAAANQAMMINQQPISQGYSHLFMTMAAAGGASQSSNSGLLQSLLGTQIHPNLYPLPTSSGTSTTGHNLIRATPITAHHQPVTPSISTTSHATTTEWQSFMGNVSPPGSDPRFWSIGRSAGGEGSGVGTGTAAGVGTSKDVGSSSSPNRWPEFPGCGPDDDDDSS